MTKLSNYVSKAPEFQKLPEGQHKVRLAAYKELTSFHNYDGSVKDNLPGFSNPTEQLALTVVSTEGKGGMTHRMNLNGWLKFSDLSDKELQSGKFLEIKGYACAKDPKDGKIKRIADEKKDATCIGMLDQTFAAMGVPVGSGVDALEDVIADQNEFIVTVTRGTYEDESGERDQYRITGWKKVSAAVTAEASGIQS